jgi:sulfide:quinone oxidoreductase
MSTESTNQHQIVIVGGGTAGTSVAASLLRHRPSLDVAVVEPSDTHYYQPAWTLVGGGVCKLEQTARAQKETLPESATWVQKRVTSFQPDTNRITLADGSTLAYQVLVVAPGIQLNWDQVQGLTAALGRNGVCSNYSPDYAPYTWDCLRQFQGGKAIFTQPAPPLKCAGAPQKIAYLAADHARRNGVLDNSEFHFYSGAGALFSVPDFVPYLEEVAQGYGIGIHLSHELVAVDGDNRIATFRTKDSEGNTRDVEQAFDLLHVTPPQTAPDFVRESPLVNSEGWVDVDRNTTQHNQYPNIFSLGDASSLPTSKTAAAVRKQAPVTVANLLAHLDSAPLEASYDGYTSCPLITAYGKVILAEFMYDAVVSPTLPLNPFKESRFYWWVKTTALPAFYWRGMLRGYEPDIRHKPLKDAA